MKKAVFGFALATAVFTVLLLHPVEASAKTIYVSAGGNAAIADGSAAAPYTTLQTASDKAVAGDTVEVLAGSYAGFNRTSTQSGTPSAYVTFHAEPGVKVVSNNSKNTSGINLEGASYIIIDGFTVNNASGTITGDGIRSVTNTGVIIRNNTVDHNGLEGIFTGFSQNVTIENNIASNSIHEHGIYVSNSADNPIIRGNTAFGNNEAGIQLNGDIHTPPGDGIISNAIIEDNIIYDNGAAGGAAINLDGVQNSTISNNLLYNNHATGIVLYKGDGGGGSNNNVVSDNTVIMPSGSRWAININNGSTGNTLSNNIFYNNNLGHGSIDISSDSLFGFTSDHNALDGRITVNDGSIKLTLAQWQSTYNEDRNSVIISPSQFVAGTIRPNGISADIGESTAPVTPPTTTPVVPVPPTPPTLLTPPVPPIVSIPSQTCLALNYTETIGRDDSNTKGEVSKTQQYLKSLGFFTANVTGYFGNASASAVKKFQTKNGIYADGIVNLITRNKIKSLTCAVAETAATSTSPSDWLNSIMASIGGWLQAGMAAVIESFKGI